VKTHKGSGAVEADESPVDESLDAVDSLESVEPVRDPVLDQVAEADLEAAEAHGDDDGSPDAAASEGADSKGRAGKLKILVGATIALIVAAVAVAVAGTLGGSDDVVLPETISDPAVIIGALNDGGIVCSSSAVSGGVATCNTTVAFRIFESTGAAETYVKGMLKDPLTSSAIGWVRHGNVVVAAPLTSTPEIAAALGEGSQIY
jgi:hypothetical protein